MPFPTFNIKSRAFFAQGCMETAQGHVEGPAPESCTGLDQDAQPPFQSPSPPLPQDLTRSQLYSMLRHIQEQTDGKGMLYLPRLLF
jgi:hypothetical protein